MPIPKIDYPPFIHTRSLCVKAFVIIFLDLVILQAQFIGYQNGNLVFLTISF